MPSNNLKEAERVMVICNACRYCEGYCAVFPAMELRRTFTSQDLKYLANLCHNCRDCYYACQYAPPHEFDLNFPRAMGELRLETYQDFTWPPQLGRLFRKNAWTIVGTALAGTILALILTLVSGGFQALGQTHQGPNAFYNVIGYWVLVTVTLIIVCSAVGILGKGFLTAWRTMGRAPGELLNIGAHLRAIRDVLKLKYLDGGGHGCNYPDDQFRMVRRNLHHLVFYGFALCFASTTIAFFYDHFLQRPAPYPFISLPVVLGTLGGAGILIGAGALLWLKTEMDRRPAPRNVLNMDVAFLVLLFLVSLTGLLLLVLRETSLMGLLMVVHVGLVFGLFISFPYGKFVHAVYRYAALLGNAIEQLRPGG